MALDHHLRDLFSFKPDLVHYDITSTDFEGAGPAGLAKHGHSRDGKPHNVQVIVAVVMVAGWPIAHHVWAGNEVDHTTVGKAIADLHRRFGFNRLVFVGDRGLLIAHSSRRCRSAKNRRPPSAGADRARSPAVARSTGKRLPLDCCRLSAGPLAL